MSDITITPNTDSLDLDFTFDTPQQFGYTINIYDTANGYANLFKDQGQSYGENKKTHFTIGQASNLIGKNLSIFWIIVDPSGAGNKYSASATISQNGNNCTNSQTISGTTNDNKVEDSSSGNFVNN